MRVRCATPADAGGIARVHVEGWRTAYAKLLPAGFLLGLSKEARTQSWVEILSRTGTNEITYVAENEGNVIGFVSSGPERSNDPQFVGELYAIYLLDSFQRKGIGTALFQKIVEFLRSKQLFPMKVWVLRDNPNRVFYERQGGFVVGEKVIKIGETELIETAYGWPDETAELT